ncbi:MAG: DUF2336 domain-containing protein [Alphaproteobacteria bacterium]
MLKGIFSGKKQQKPANAPKIGDEYIQTRAILESGDENAMRNLASRPDTPPEAMYYMADKGSNSVKRAVAENKNSPGQADFLLAKSGDSDTRQALAVKVGEILPAFDGRQGAQVERLIMQVVDVLAKDRLPTIRAVLAEQIKNLENVPPEIIQDLARDAEAFVAAPVLQFSPLLTDRDLIDIISTGIGSEALIAVSQRQGLSEAVSQAVVDTEDDHAIPALLANRTARIGMEAMESIVAAGEKNAAWHQALVSRENIERSLVQRIASYVSESLVAELVRNNPTVGADIGVSLRDAVRKRMASLQDAWDSFDPEVRRAEIFHHDNRLSSATMIQAASKGEETFVVHALSLITKIEVARIRGALSSADGRLAAVALAWYAELGQDFSHAVQRHLLGVSEEETLYDTRGYGYPCERVDMEQVIAFLKE